MRRRESASVVQVDKCSQLACQHFVDDFGTGRKEKIKCLRLPLETRMDLRCRDG